MSNLKRFINGDMNEQEMEQFTKEIIHQQLDIETRQRWQTTLKTRYGVEREQPALRVRSRQWGRFLAIAATVAGLIGLFFWLRMPTSLDGSQLAAQYIDELPIMADQLVFRKGAAEVASLRTDAYTAYSRADYATAIQQWQALEAMDSLTTYDQFYWGTSCLRQTPSDPSCTLTRLAAVADQAPELQQEIDWVQALAYTQQGDTDNAIPLLEQIVARKQFMEAAAVTLLEALHSSQ